MDASYPCQWKGGDHPTTGGCESHHCTQVVQLSSETCSRAGHCNGTGPTLPKCGDGKFFCGSNGTTIRPLYGSCPPPNHHPDHGNRGVHTLNANTFQCRQICPSITRKSQDIIVAEGSAKRFPQWLPQHHRKPNHQVPQSKPRHSQGPHEVTGIQDQEHAPKAVLPSYAPCARSAPNATVIHGNAEHARSAPRAAGISGSPWQ